MNGMNIGIEAMTEVVLDSDTSIEAAMLEVTEAAVLLQADTEELNMLAMFEENFSAIKSTVVTNGIDAGTESLVGGVMAQQLAVWDAEDIEGTVASMEKTEETTWEKIKDYIQRVFEKIKQFFSKLLLNQAIIEKALQKQLQRVKALKGAEWKKENKQFKFVMSDKAEDIVETVFETTQQVIAAIGSKTFEIKSNKDMDALVNGDLQKSLKVAFASASSEKAEGKFKFATVAKRAEALTKSAVNYKRRGQVIKSASVKLLEEGKNNAYRPARCVGRTSSVLSTCSIGALRDMRTMVSLLKNVK